MIELADISYAYAGEPALTGVSLRVAGGELVALAGANGSGKTTLLCLLAGLYTPSAGRLRVGDAHSPGREKELRRRTGLVLQDADLQILGATVAEDLGLGLERGEADSPEGRERIAEAARRLGLEAGLDKPVHTLSYGQKRKLCLAATLLARPEVLLLDEPFAGLDYPAALEMRAILRANKEAGLTQVVAAHDLDPLMDLADGLAVLQAGRLALSGPPAEVVGELRRFDIRPPGAAWE